MDNLIRVIARDGSVMCCACLLYTSVVYAHRAKNAGDMPEIADLLAKL